MVANATAYLTPPRFSANCVTDILPSQLMLGNVALGAGSTLDACASSPPAPLARMQRQPKIALQIASLQTEGAFRLLRRRPSNG